MKTIVFKIKLIAFLLLLQLNAVAQTSALLKPQSPPKLVNDFANVLSYSEKQWLEDKLVAFDKESSTQINIITIDTLVGYDIADYAIEIGNLWGVGREKKNNGVMVLVAIKNRKANISPGYGLEGALPDVLCKQIIDNEMKPYFKDGYYYGGLDKAADAIIAASKGKYKHDGSYGSSGGGIPRWLIILILIIGIPTSILFIQWLLRRLWEMITGKKIKRRVREYYYSPTATTTQEETKSTSSSSSGSSNDSFEGYGGGSFGGGGASGSW